jgi:hypothetical protein
MSTRRLKTHLVKQDMKAMELIGSVRTQELSYHISHALQANILREVCVDW